MFLLVNFNEDELFTVKLLIVTRKTKLSAKKYFLFSLIFPDNFFFNQNNNNEVKHFSLFCFIAVK